jgi:hypothetical protein
VTIVAAGLHRAWAEHWRSCWVFPLPATWGGEPGSCFE